MSFSSIPEPELINPVPAEEVPGWVHSMATTFLQDRQSPDTQWWIEDLQPRWDPDRTWGIRSGRDWVGTLRTVSRTLTVPTGPGRAAEITVDALTNVTVSATHRRRGLMSRMLNGSLRAARDRGDALSVLIAAEWPIYGRFGYAPATLSADYMLQTRRPGADCPGDPSRVRQVERDEFGHLAAEVFAAAGRRRHGQIDRGSGWWQSQLGLNGDAPRSGLPHNWFLHVGEDGVDGLLAWSAQGSHSPVAPDQSLDVWLLSAASDAAYLDLWAYLTGVDVVERVRLINRPVDEPARWLLDDGRTLVLSHAVDFLWLRILDVPAALSARRYAIPGELVLAVRDQDAGGFAAGRYRLTAEEGGAQCTATEATPDLEISQRVLASIYLGGFRLREVCLAGAVTEHSPGALDRLDLMFSTSLAPWNPTWF